MLSTQKMLRLSPFISVSSSSFTFCQKHPCYFAVSLLQAKPYFPAMGHRDSLSGGKRLPTMPQTQEVIETPDLLLQNPDLLAALELFLPDSELM